MKQSVTSCSIEKMNHDYQTWQRLVFMETMTYSMIECFKCHIFKKYFSNVNNLNKMLTHIYFLCEKY